MSYRYVETILGDDKNETQLKFKGYTIIKLIQIVEEFKPAFSIWSTTFKMHISEVQKYFFSEKVHIFTLYSVPIKTS